MLNTSQETRECLALGSVSRTFLYELQLTESEWLRWTSAGSPVEFESNIFSPQTIKHSSPQLSIDGSRPQVTVTVGNADRVMQYYFRQYHLKRKVIRLIELLTETGDYFEMRLMIAGATSTSETMSITCTIPGAGGIEIPGRVITSSVCRWTFKDADCGYSGSGGPCKNTFLSCRALGNISRFGGFPGVPRAGIYV